MTSSLLDNFNPNEYLYLNPEITINNSISTVEEIVSYYTTTGQYDTTTVNSINLPTDFNYKIYYYFNKTYIKSDILTLYNLYNASDPERLSIIHYMRYYDYYKTNNDITLKYSIPIDFSVEMYKTFNDMSLDYLMPSEYYIKYIEKSNTSNSNTLNIDGSDVNLTIGTISDFMINLFNRKFSETLQINSDMHVSGQLVASNLKVKDTILASNLYVDTLTVTNETFTETLFQDGVKLEKQLTVNGSNSVFTSNVQIKELLITNTSEFSGDVLMNCNLNIHSNLDVKSNTTLCNLSVNSVSIFNDTTYLKSNVYISGGETQILNNTYMDYVIIGKTLQVLNDSSFSNNMYINSNLIVNSNVNINGNLVVNVDTNLNNTLQVVNNVSFSNNLNVNNIITATEYLTLSDYRIKKVINNYDIRDARNIITNIDVKEYKVLNNRRKSIGIIAQELELLRQDIIHTAPNYKILINQYAELVSDCKYLLEGHNFSLNDTILYSADTEDSEYIIESKINYVKGDLFTLTNATYDKIFIRERIISNFKSINYTELLMMCICCIQDLYNYITV